MKKRIFNLYFYKSLANTNNEIKRLDKEENFSRINLGLFSLNQKFGKGRSGNIWISKKGDLTCSFLINKTFDVKKIGQINILVSWCLLTTLKSLRDIGNSILVVEHDQETIQSSDFIIDLGPGAGKNGGEITFSGSPEQILKSKKSLTGKYLAGIKVIDVPETRRNSTSKFLA